ncbi:MAG: TatD family hydrolase [Alphaproteobacteria bacterium]|jgi:TatD DNase family protein|nr:TatD family hydrolase [Alphaproteobacteria bacterium]
MLVDNHCHLDFPDYEDDLDEVVARARRAGVGVIQTISTRMTTFPKVLAVAERYDDMYCSVGVHPHNAGDEGDVTCTELVAATDHPKVIGIGESGLDYYYERSPRDAQRTSFRSHIAAARESGLPLIVHSRDADEDTAEILKDEAGKGAFPGLIHCFTSGRELAETALDLGMSISISGIVTFRNAEALRDIVRDIPLDRLLVETDAPFLAPVPNRGRRNEPAYVAHTAATVAELLDIDGARLAEATTANFHALFTKARVAAVAS